LELKMTEKQVKWLLIMKPRKPTTPRTWMPQLKKRNGLARIVLPLSWIYRQTLTWKLIYISFLWTNLYSTYKRQTRPLVREGAPQEQDRNCHTSNKYLVMGPTWGSIPRLTYWLTVSRNVTLTDFNWTIHTYE
jgi:hypothetical protein